MTEVYYIVNKHILASKISAAFALLAFFIAFLTGLFYGNQITQVFIRSAIAMLLFGVLGYILGYLLGNTFTRRYGEDTRNSESQERKQLESSS